MRRHLEIFLKFTHATGHPHPHLEAAFNNYAALLQAMGRSRDQVLATLREMAPELFKETLPQPTGEEVTPEQARGIALELYKRGDYARAAGLLKALLEAGFEIVSTRLHLARIALITGDLPHAREHVAQTWAAHHDAEAYILARILWLQLALALLDGDAPTPYLGRIKTALQVPDVHMEWAMNPVLDALRPKLSADVHALLTALVAALSFPDKCAALDAFPAWREAEPEPLL